MSRSGAGVSARGGGTKELGRCCRPGPAAARTSRGATLGGAQAPRRPKLEMAAELRRVRVRLRPAREGRGEAGPARGGRGGGGVPAGARGGRPAREGRRVHRRWEAGLHPPILRDLGC